MTTRGGIAKLDHLASLPSMTYVHAIMILVAGVTFILVQGGLDNKIFHKGLTEWRKKHATTEL